MKCAIIIFIRVPEPGQTKARMMPASNAKDCTHPHTYFLEDIKRRCGKVEGRLFVCFTPDDGRERLYPAFGRGEHYISQKNSGLGERMYQIIQGVLGRGYEAYTPVETDAPEVRSGYLERVFGLLEQNDVIPGPTRDRGYYLVGMKRPQWGVSDVEGYEQGFVLRDTMCRLKTAGCGVGLTETLWGMDVYQDLQGYRQRIQEDKRLQETSTGRYLTRTNRISIIVSVHDEEEAIVQMQGQLGPLRRKCEILLVGGGSTGRTVEWIRPWVRIIHLEKGWARQVNTGVVESRGDVLFFLRCDSELSPHPPAEIHRVMKDHSAGCPGIVFYPSNSFMFTYRVTPNRQIKDYRITFRDQGIFVGHSLFFNTGMSPETPIMEDYQFPFTLKEEGVRLGVIGQCIYISDRRFPKGTLSELKLIWKISRLRKIYRDRVPIEQIDRMYRGVR